MNVIVCGPRVDLRKGGVDNSKLETDAATLGEALQKYEAAFGCVFAPYDGSSPGVPFEPGGTPRYFFRTTREGRKELVDIHIERAGEDLCPKQDLSFSLMDGDVIRYGPLIC